MSDPVETALRKLLAARDVGATVCPSEVARALATDRDQPEDWRADMAGVHATVDRLLAGGQVRLSWQGVPLPARAGPYRIARGKD